MKEAPSSAEHTEHRRLAAIMFTDIVGFSRQIGADEARMLRLLEVHTQIVQHTVEEHHGTVIKTVGDAFLVDFPSEILTRSSLGESTHQGPSEVRAAYYGITESGAEVSVEGKARATVHKRLPQTLWQAHCSTYGRRLNRRFD